MDSVAMSLTDILKSFGVSHERDAYSEKDHCHVLRAPDGSVIGRFDAHSAWVHIDMIRKTAMKRAKNG